jgi:hypothetical protein
MKFQLFLEFNLDNSMDKREMPLLQWAKPTVVLRLSRLRGLAHLALSAHGKNWWGLLCFRRRRLAAKIWSADARWWSGRGASPIDGESDLGWRAAGCSPERSAGGGTTRRKGKLIGGVDEGLPVVEVWSKRNKGVLRSSSRRWLGQRRSRAVGRWWGLTEDAGGGEKWLPRAVSHWFELDGVAAPSADEGGAIDPHGRWRVGFTAAGDGEQSDNDRAESKCREHAWGGWKWSLGAVPLRPHAG